MGRKIRHSRSHHRAHCERHGWHQGSVSKRWHGRLHIEAHSGGNAIGGCKYMGEPEKKDANRSLLTGVRRVLLVASIDAIGTSRMPKLLRRAGLDVTLLGPAGI